MRLSVLFLAFIITTTVSSTVFGEKQSPDQGAYNIIKKAEKIRTPHNTKSMVKLFTVNGDQKVSYELEVLKGENRKAFVNFLKPAEEKGRKMLSIGRKYWSTFPDSKFVLEISRREAIGNSAFAMADIFQIDVDTEYSVKLIGKEKLGKIECYKLELNQKIDDAAYFKIEYWASVKDTFPIQAKFYGQSGKHLKTMKLKKRMKLAGKIRPAIIQMKDEIKKNTYSIWTNRSMKSESFPANIFTKEYLKTRS